MLKNKNKKFKALMLDVDGTTVPLKMDAMPSERVTRAIVAASKKMHVGLATSRPFFILEHILSHLKLSGPTIMSGGSQIIDLPAKKIVWEKTMETKDIENIFQTIKKYDLRFMLLDGNEEFEYSGTQVLRKPLEIYVPALNLERVEQLLDELSHIDTIHAMKTVSWKIGKYDLLISHALATKQHGIFEVAKILNIDTHDIIGVGDSYNDFPLLMACGLKVAMGNAVPEIKEIADYIAPRVEDDGVADVIERFVL